MTQSDLVDSVQLTELCGSAPHWDRGELGETAAGALSEAAPGFLRLVSPFRCKMWEFVDRLDDDVSEKTSRDTLASISTHGQKVPALARRLQGDDLYDYEIICGAHRLSSARHLNSPLLVEVRSITDRQAAISVDSDSRFRRKLSPYERGFTYAHWLNQNLFESQEDLARALKLSPAQVSRLMSLVQLPQVIVQAFQSPLEIRETWGVALLKAWQEPEKRERIASRAASIRSGEEAVTAVDVYQGLIAKSRKGKNRGTKLAPTTSEIVKDSRGALLFEIRRYRDKVAFVVPKSRALRQMHEIKKAVANGITPVREH